MSRDYKGPSPRRDANRRSGSLLVGILIGLVMGLAIALAVAWYINKMPTPFLTPAPAPKADPAKVPPRKEPAPVAADTKPRFDFYKILPGTEEPATDQQVRDAQRRAAPAETFFLQAGAFQNAPDADQRKAQLALLGVEATVQTTVMPDKTVWHRVRVGPYAAIEEINRVRDVLKQGGIETTLIKARDATAPATK